jgi:arginine deiminase
MPIEDIIKDHDLLAKVLSHYRYRLEHLHEDLESKFSMSNAMKENLAFKQTVKQIEELLATTGAKSQEEAKKYAELLTLAISQYAKDLEAVLEKGKKMLPQIPDGDLHRLEDELKAVKAYLTQ